MGSGKEELNAFLCLSQQKIHADQGASCYYIDDGGHHVKPALHLLRLTPRGGSGDKEQLPCCNPSILLPSDRASFCWSPPSCRCALTGMWGVACCGLLPPPTHINTSECGLTGHRPQPSGHQSWIIRKTGFKHLQLVRLRDCSIIKMRLYWYHIPLVHQFSLIGSYVYCMKM